MINQELNIALLEMFDEVDKEEIFKNYCAIENEVLKSDIVKIVAEINNLNEEISRVEYQPYQLELKNKIELLENDLLANPLYQEYLHAYEMCNQRLEELAKIIFKDIINVREMSECACSKW